MLDDKLTPGADDHEVMQQMKEQGIQVDIDTEEPVPIPLVPAYISLEIAPEYFKPELSI